MLRRLACLACLASLACSAFAGRSMPEAAFTHADAWRTESAGRRKLQQLPSLADGGKSAVEMLLTAVGASPSMFQLAFAKLQSAFVVQEYITIIDNTVSLNTFSDPFTNITTVTPGEFFWDLGSGLTLELGVSALVYANSVSNLNGTIPAAGIQILVDSIEGKVNVPAHRRRLMSAGPETPPKVAPMQEPEVMSVPRKLTQTLSAADVAGLTFSGFWEQLQNIIPPRLLTNLTKLLAASSRPVDEFLALSQTTPEQLAAAVAAYGDGNLTIAFPTKPAVASVTVIPCLDIELSVTVLDQANQAGANVRVTPFATRFLGQSVFQSVKVAPFASAFATLVTTPYALAGDAASALNATAQILRNGDTTPLTEFVQAKAAAIELQVSPVPTTLTLAFDLLIRAQVQVNGGDIALVL